MAKPNSVTVADPAAAFQRFQDTLRHAMSVPKKLIDKRIAKDRAAKKKRK